MDSRSCKKGRGNVTSDKGAPTTNKEAKFDVTMAEEALAEVAGERKEGVEGFMAVEEAEVEVLQWSGVDEEMAWASCWFPFWEVQATGDAYEALYGDVLDYDIWGLKNAHNFSPNNT